MFKGVGTGLEFSRCGDEARGRNERGELSGEKIDRAKKQRDQQHKRNHAYENVGDYEAISETPQHSGGDAANDQKQKKRNYDGAEESYPAAQRCAEVATQGAG